MNKVIIDYYRQSKIMLRPEKKLKKANEKALKNQNSHQRKHNEVERVIGVDIKAAKIEKKVKEIVRSHLIPKSKVKRSVANNILKYYKK